MMSQIKCSDATERKWNLRNMQENREELRDGEQGGKEDQWKQSAEELKGLRDSQKSDGQMCRQRVRRGVTAEEAETGKAGDWESE